MNRKIKLLVVSLFSLALMLTSCHFAENPAHHNDLTSKTNNGPIEITDEIREKFFDLAREQRWDFLPYFGEGAAPTDLADYMNWVMIQAQVWAGFDEPNRELTPTKLSGDYVQDLIKRHFAIEVTLPTDEDYVDRFAFDGSDFIVQVGGWANPPYCEIVDLVVQQVNEQKIYTAKLLDYQPMDGSLSDIPRETIISAASDKSDICAFRWYEIKFYLDSTTDDIVFLSVTGGDLL